MAQKTIQGKIWVLTGPDGDLIEDIDTDQIYHNAFLHITDIEQMGAYALGNLEGWKDFSKKAAQGDIVAAGRNFGAGSSRQQAVDCFVSLGISLILAPSFGAIYYRNAVNSGFPVLRCPVLNEIVAAGEIKTGDNIQVRFAEGEAVIAGRDKTFAFEPMNRVQQQIFEAGGLFSFAKSAEHRR